MTGCCNKKPPLPRRQTRERSVGWDEALADYELLSAEHVAIMACDDDCAK